ncbi:uncharacterized protein LOC129594454 [Paramacrobiotus metropolitanus]|uniref:uncharacterized protein LOC129594454 n=1 Tax=Paramacrobiotus metropolitanus TaxID=2943436 RepID=UPI002446270C|nr:uncharacterized protein LOC129594454 [Paramacrobiotus metropolitanus]
MHKQSNTSQPYNIQATFTALYRFLTDQPELFEISLSDEALERYFQLSEEMEQLKKDRHVKIREKKMTSFTQSYAKLKEMVLKLALILHVLERALQSFNETGTIDIPQQISLSTFEHAIKYAQTSQQVLKIFSNENVPTTAEGDMLLLYGNLLTTQLVSEATRYRNCYPFAENEKFVQFATTLQQQGLGHLEKVQYKKGNATFMTSVDVFFKAPPSDSIASLLATHSITLNDYAEAYNAKHKMRPSKRKYLNHLIQALDEFDPYVTRVTILRNSEEVEEQHETEDDRFLCNEADTDSITSETKSDGLETIIQDFEKDEFLPTCDFEDVHERNTEPATPAKKAKLV